MGIYKIPMTYRDINKIEETISMKLGISDVEISISPIPETKEALISITEEGEPLMMNRVCSTDEFIFESYVFPNGFIGDFKFLFSGKTAGLFDIDRLGNDLFLTYWDGEDYES